jgi:hypothetical protein
MAASLFFCFVLSATINAAFGASAWHDKEPADWRFDDESGSLRFGFGRKKEERKNQSKKRLKWKKEKKINKVKRDRSDWHLSFFQTTHTRDEIEMIN